MWEVYRRNPELKLVPYNIGSFEPPFAKRFALRQYELMRQGMSKEKAYQDTEKEMAQLKDHYVQYASSHSWFVPLFARAGDISARVSGPCAYGLLWDMHSSPMLPEPPLTPFHRRPTTFSWH